MLVACALQPSITYRRRKWMAMWHTYLLKLCGNLVSSARMGYHSINQEANMLNIAENRHVFATVVNHCCLQLSWHSTTPTRTRTSSRGSSRECRLVVQLAIGITSGNRACRTCRRWFSRGCRCRGMPALFHSRFHSEHNGRPTDRTEKVGHGIKPSIGPTHQIIILLWCLY